MKERPNYYAILTAEIRYDQNITPNAKLLYAEITALCNMNGECFASNRYFSELYGKSKTSISLWVRELIVNGYISANYTYKGGTKEIDKRYLSILKGSIKNNLKGVFKKSLKNNTTSKNTNIIYNNKEIYKRKTIFWDIVFQVTDVSQDVLTEFCDYWTEPNKSNNKMRFELQKTFDINLRLKRWCKNSWNKKGMSSIEKHISSQKGAEKLLKEYHDKNNK